MITCNFFGGLGNNLFQLATVYSIHKKFGYEMSIPSITSRPGADRINQSSKLELMDLFENEFQYNDELEGLTQYVNSDTHLVEYSYTPTPNTDNTCYFGYFQSEKYFLGVDVAKDFVVKSENIKAIESMYGDCFNKKTISLHYRLGGDRPSQHMQNYHKNVSIDFYKKALELVKYNPEEYNILVFTDNIPLCEQLLETLGHEFTIIDNDNNNILDFTFMSLCDVNIVGNSTFAWWAAYVNKKDNMVIVTEDEWFGPGYSHFNLKDVFPEKWVKI